MYKERCAIQYILKFWPPKPSFPVLSIDKSLPVDYIVPGHGNIGGKEILHKLGKYLSSIKENMSKLVEAGLGRDEAAADKSFEKFYWADTNSGAYWAKQREETFRKGLEKLYDDIARTGPSR